MSKDAKYPDKPMYSVEQERIQDEVDKKEQQAQYFRDLVGAINKKFEK